MATEIGYESQVTPREGAAKPLQTANHFGAPVGEALQNVGDELHQRRVRSYQLDRKLAEDRQQADFWRKFALHRQNMDGIVREVRANPTSDDYGEHVSRVREAAGAAREGLLAGITEQSVLDMASRQLDEFDTNVGERESAYAEGQRVAKLVVDIDKTVDMGANRIRTGMDPDHYVEELRTGHAMIEAQRGITPADRGKLHKALGERYGQAFVEHLIDTNPAAAIATLDQGLYTEQLAPEQVSALRNAAEVETRRVDARAAHEAAVARAAFAEKVATVKARSTNGEDVSAELPALIQAAAAAGDTSTAEQLTGIARESAFAKVWESQPPIARANRIAALNRKPAGERSPDEQAELKWLEDKRASLDARFAADPVAFAAENGTPNAVPPALEFGNAASWSARMEWRRTMSRANGRDMPPLTKAEAEQIAAQRGQNDKAVFAELDLIGGARDRAAAAKQIAPNDVTFQHVAMLRPAARVNVTQGADKLKAMPQFLKPSADKPEVADWIKAHEAGIRVALRQMNVPDQEATVTVMRQYLAGTLAHTGHDADAVTVSQVQIAAAVAMGGGLREGKLHGGIGNWGGNVFVVPSHLTQQQFSNRAGTWFATRRGGGAVNPDGSPIPIARLIPVMVWPNVYRWEGPGQRVAVDKTGKPLEMDVGQ